MAEQAESTPVSERVQIFVSQVEELERDTLTPEEFKRYQGYKAILGPLLGSLPITQQKTVVNTEVLTTLLGDDQPDYEELERKVAAAVFEARLDRVLTGKTE